MMFLQYRVGDIVKIKSIPDSIFSVNVGKIVKSTPMTLKIQWMDGVVGNYTWDLVKEYKIKNLSYENFKQIFPTATSLQVKTLETQKLGRSVDYCFQ